MPAPTAVSFLEVLHRFDKLSLWEHLVSDDNGEWIHRSIFECVVVNYHRRFVLKRHLNRDQFCRYSDILQTEEKQV